MEQSQFPSQGLNLGVIYRRHPSGRMPTRRDELSVCSHDKRDLNHYFARATIGLFANSTHETRPTRDELMSFQFVRFLQFY